MIMYHAVEHRQRLHERLVIDQVLRVQVEHEEIV
jgi:hypothetical protein